MLESNEILLKPANVQRTTPETYSKSQKEDVLLKPLTLKKITPKVYNEQQDNDVLLEPLDIKKPKPDVYNTSQPEDFLLEPKMLPARKEIQPGKLLTHYNGVNYITKPNQYFSIFNKFSELDTKEKKLAARINLGIDGLAYWGNIQGYIEDQTDLFDYLQSYFESLQEQINNLQEQIELLQNSISK